MWRKLGCFSWPPKGCYPFEDWSELPEFPVRPVAIPLSAFRLDWRDPRYFNNRDDRPHHFNAHGSEYMHGPEQLAEERAAQAQFLAAKQAKHH
jgi:hypothetical protein